MRPEILYPLFADIGTLKGVGKAIQKNFERIGVNKVIDLLFHLPINVIDRSYQPKITEIKEGDIVTLELQIDSHIESHVKLKHAKIPYKVICHNDSGYINLVFFSTYGDYIKKILPVGGKRAVSGKVEFFNGEAQITHPDYIVPLSEVDKIKKPEPVYPLTAGINNKMLIRTIAQCLGKIPDLTEWIDKNFLKENNWQSWKASLLKAHFPENVSDISHGSEARQRLSYDEIFASQIKLFLIRKNVFREKVSQITSSSGLEKEFHNLLPFKLTAGQQKVISEIREDFLAGRKMMRLLQGDVGSGKTVVAATAMLDVIGSGGQVAFMAPTEILASQHFDFLNKYFSQIGIRIGLLNSKIKGRGKKQTLEAISEGEVDVIVGTQALFQNNVEFYNLAFAVIDEQHRFGVEQRAALAEKGNGVHILLMTATPIPRTLSMTLYGDMDISSLREKPKGRMPVETRVVPSSRMEEVIEAIKRAINNGEKVYWICPLIQESEKSDLTAVEERFEQFKKIFADKAGLLHGKMKSEERENVMLKFSLGDISILVATTVIEVGVDVPDATIMIIEHSERFGLSQLHQLRGRVGRGEKKSSCLLLYAEPVGEIAKSRLKVIRETEDGFLIAEEDLKLRGGGEVLGIKQSGFMEFKIADLGQDYDLVVHARDAAKKLVLEESQDSTIKSLLHIFEYEEGKRYFSN